MQIYLVVFDKTAFQLSEKLFHSVASYIDQHFVDECEKTIYGVSDEIRQSRRRHRQQTQYMEVCENSVAFEDLLPCAPQAISLEDTLAQLDAGFSETLLKLIDESGHKDSTIYKKALLSKQHFSKIRSNPNYRPTKQTAIALALALELNVEQTNDLIGRAGYTLTKSSKFDLIIQYFIEQQIYNVVQINTVLYEFDQSLLGS